ncbi:MAG: succinylglutamate desuccinylase/aspartoacylase family protein [Myxococcales bacterium]|nr:succinylglutamate desuccinylase/aspartoacylase family protein [Myxococcales bacterium]
MTGRPVAKGRVARRVDLLSLGTGHEALPLLVLTADRPGPCVAVTANVHGDEVTGLAAVHALDRILTAELTCGCVVLVPSLNPRGLMMQRRVQPDDGLDLNRAFPGDPDGQGAARIAGTVWRGLMQRSLDVLVDLHADSAVAIPYAIVDRSIRLSRPEREAMDTRLVGIAEASGLTVLREYPDDLYLRFRLDQSLAGAMVNHGKVPAVTLEVGPRRAVSGESVRTTVTAVLRILHHMGNVAQPPAGALPRLQGGPWRRAAAPRVRTAGVFVPSRDPGATFRSGEALGEVRGVDGTVREVVRADADGLVVSWSENAWIDARGVPGTLGLCGR